MTPQSQLVLEHLLAHGSITNVEANAVHKVRSVSRRITEIARHGFVIRKEMRTDVTGQRYVKYVLVAQNNPRHLPVPVSPTTGRMFDFVKHLAARAPRLPA